MREVTSLVVASIDRYFRMGPTRCSWYKHDWVVCVMKFCIESVLSRVTPKFFTVGERNRKVA